MSESFFIAVAGTECRKKRRHFSDMNNKNGILKFVTHSRTVLRIAIQHGWLPGARYTNLRDVREFPRLGFLDIDWKNYNFTRHLLAAQSTKPLITVAQDVEDKHGLNQILEQAYRLADYADHVVIVPKDPTFDEESINGIPERFLLGYSVPTRYGKTTLKTEIFRRPVHLLGGRPDVQLQLARRLKVFSLDCNRFTLDARYGDFFDGETFRPHPIGGYDRCVRDSLTNISRLWISHN
jgi:hypothetical protein